MGNHADPIYPMTATGTGDRTGNSIGGILDVAAEATLELQSHQDRSNITLSEIGLESGMIGSGRPMTSFVDMVRRNLNASWKFLRASDDASSS